MKSKLLTLAGALVVAVFTGCQTPTKTGTLASVVVTNQPISAITQAVDAVFVSHGYSGGRIGPGQYSYHRIATQSDNVISNAGSFDSIVTVRVIVVINQIDAGSTLVGCDAWLIKGANDSPFAGGREIREVRPGPYQQMLRDIQTQLGQ